MSGKVLYTSLKKKKIYHRKNNNFVIFVIHSKQNLLHSTVTPQTQNFL